jgi:inositol oxygenase
MAVHKKKFRQEFRKANDRSTEFYKEHHKKQTMSYVLSQKAKFGKLGRRKAGIWEIFDDLDSIYDSSDPDLNLPQSVHAFQTAEAIRKDGHPPWMVMVGLIHDLGKVLLLMGEPQWAVVGDTFPVGCRYSSEIVHYGFLHYNPNYGDIKYQKHLGIYNRGCGWDNLHFTWGHDEYLYQVLKQAQEKDPESMKLPEQALYIIRYHSFYPGHQHGAYKYDEIKKQFPYYVALIRSFVPGKLQW